MFSKNIEQKVQDDISLICGLALTLNIGKYLGINLLSMENQ